MVVKAQVLTGGRGKAGGVKLADGPAEAEAKAREILGLDIRGHVVRKLWVEQRVRHREGVLPLGHVRPLREEAAVHAHDARAGSTSRRSRRRSRRLSRGCTRTCSKASSRTRAAGLIYGSGIDDPGEQKQVLDIIGRLYECFTQSDAMLCEINPLVVTPDGTVKALDAKVTIDDSALFRHPDLAEMRDIGAADPLEAFAREKGVTYVKLDGSVGILGNGAGLSMSTVDVVVVAGGRPANFCDLGGGGDAQGVVDALEVIVRDADVRSIFFNIFGGITRGDEVARGILTALDQMSIELADRGPAGRHERRGGQAVADRRRAAESPRRADDARRRAARRGAGGMTDRWSTHAQAYRESEAHRSGADLDLLVEWAEGKTALDVATGGGHVARRLREAGLDVVTVDPAPGMEPDVISRAEHLPFADGSFDLVVTRIAPHHFADVQAAVDEMARVSGNLVLVVDNLYRDDIVEEAERLRDPTHVRNYGEEDWRELFERAGLDVEAVELVDTDIDARGVARPRRLRGRRGRARQGAARRPRSRRPPGDDADRAQGAQGRDRLMAIVVDKDTRLVVQGLTGSEGRFHGLRNRNYGTNVVAGVTPGKGGADVEGIPVFNTVAEAVSEAEANTTLIFVPARFAVDAVYEAVDAGIGTVICITEHIPAHDMLRVYTYIRPLGITLVGPNCPGVLSPGKANVGIIPAEIFSEGNVGLVSRSGTLTYQIGHELTQLGLGNSTIVGIGGDPVVGSSFIDILEKFEADPETEYVVLVGEIGGNEEEKAAAFIAERMIEAGVRLHRRLLGAAGQDDGPRRGDHLRHVRDGAGEEGGARGGRRRRSGRRPPRSPSSSPSGSGFARDLVRARRPRA